MTALSPALVEKVARKIHHDRLSWPEVRLDQWERMEAGYRECCERDAVSAIRAVYKHQRVVTDAMRRAGAEATLACGPEDDALAVAYLAMLEAAFEGEKK